ncbi:hypothetical protein ACL07V_35360 [Streptomyces sp. MB22_4]|uniref:hypothetical protein n=1 Tax=Streptomyces sp. MB22_4 TaxID=3383120 RepID=UPI0039A08D26
MDQAAGNGGLSQMRTGEHDGASSCRRAAISRSRRSRQEKLFRPPRWPSSRQGRQSRQDRQVSLDRRPGSQQVRAAMRVRLRDRPRTGTILRPRWDQLLGCGGVMENPASSPKASQVPRAAESSAQDHAFVDPPGHRLVVPLDGASGRHRQNQRLRTSSSRTP